MIQLDLDWDSTLAEVENDIDSDINALSPKGLIENWTWGRSISELAAQSLIGISVEKADKYSKAKIDDPDFWSWLWYCLAKEACATIDDAALLIADIALVLPYSAQYFYYCFREWSEYDIKKEAMIKVHPLFALISMLSEEWVKAVQSMIWSMWSPEKWTAGWVAIMAVALLWLLAGGAGLAKLWSSLVMKWWKALEKVWWVTWRVWEKIYSWAEVVNKYAWKAMNTLNRADDFINAGWNLAMKWWLHVTWATISTIWSWVSKGIWKALEWKKTLNNVWVINSQAVVDRIMGDSYMLAQFDKIKERTLEMTLQKMAKNSLLDDAGRKAWLRKDFPDLTPTQIDEICRIHNEMPWCLLKHKQGEWIGKFKAMFSVDIPWEKAQKIMDYGYAGKMEKTAPEVTEQIKFFERENPNKFEWGDDTIIYRYADNESWINEPSIEDKVTDKNNWVWTYWHVERPHTEYASKVLIKTTVRELKDQGIDIRVDDFAPSSSWGDSISLIWIADRNLTRVPWERQVISWYWIDWKTPIFLNTKNEAVYSDWKLVDWRWTWTNWEVFFSDEVMLREKALELKKAPSPYKIDVPYWENPKVNSEAFNDIKNNIERSKEQMLSNPEYQWLLSEMDIDFVASEYIRYYNNATVSKWDFLKSLMTNESFKKMDWEDLEILLLDINIWWDIPWTGLSGYMYNLSEMRIDPSDVI